MTSYPNNLLDAMYGRHNIKGFEQLMLDTALRDALTRRQHPIILNRYILGKSRKELAEMMGCTVNSVGNIERTALRRLRKYISEYLYAVGGEDLRDFQEPKNVSTDHSTPYPQNILALIFEGQPPELKTDIIGMLDKLYAYSLTTVQAQVIRALYIDHMSQAELARKLGCKPSNIYFREHKALATMQREAFRCVLVKGGPDRPRGLASFRKDGGGPIPAEEVYRGTVDLLPISTRARNSLIYDNITTVADLVECTPERLLTIPSFGITSLHEVESLLSELGLSLKSA